MILTFVLKPFSDAVKELRVSSDRSVTISWWSGHYTTHKNVRRRDMLRLLDTKASRGKWVNEFALNAL
jgi:hypothetical protein